MLLQLIVITFVVQDTAEAYDSTIVTKQGWSIALGPWKQLPMNLFLMYMAGNSISLFPIMMVGMMAYRPVQALIGYREGVKLLSVCMRLCVVFCGIRVTSQ